jgi:hypothetical protein
MPQVRIARQFSLGRWSKRQFHDAEKAPPE